MQKQFLFIIDPFETLNPKKDTSLALIKAALDQSTIPYICSMHDFSVSKKKVTITAQKVTLPDHYRDLSISDKYLSNAEVIDSADFSVIFMRKDPPVDDLYITVTQILALCERYGSKIVNPPQMLQSLNEKIFSFYFPDLVPDFCFSADFETLETFAKAHPRIIMKPIDGMGGKGIFVTSYDDPNLPVIYETLTAYGRHPVLAQAFVDDITNGDKRILILHGEAFPFCLARIPTGRNIRGNLAAGGTYETRPLTSTDLEIANKIAPFLVENNIDLCGIDVIGDKLTEINITSPTCFLEISDASETNIAKKYIEKYIKM